MNTRERNLLIGLGGAAILYVAYSYLYPAVMAPITDRQNKLAEVTDKVDKSDAEILQLLQKRKQLGQWKAVSLPADPPTTKRPDALNAQRLYLNWLGSIAEKSRLQRVKTAPERRQTKPNLYISVAISLTGEGTAAQISDFLARLELAPLLHRVNRVRIESTDVTGNPPFKIDLELEGIVFPESRPRNTLFPETSLKEALAAGGTELTVTDPLAIRLPTPFEILVGDERRQVQAINTTTGVWKLQKSPSNKAFPAGTIVQVPAAPPEAMITALASQIQSGWRFLKPVPPAKYDPRLEAQGEAVLLTGTPLRQTIELKGTAGSTPTLKPTGTWPAGLSFDAQSRRITGELPKGSASAESSNNELTLTFDVLPEKDAFPTVERSIRFTIKDPNTPPEIATVTKLLPAVAGRVWKLEPQATDRETSRDKLKWSAVSLIEGMSFDSKTGRIEWIPSISAEPGAKSVELRVTDDSNPPLAATRVFNFELSEDLPQYTYLIAVIEGPVSSETTSANTTPANSSNSSSGMEVWFFDRLQSRKLVMLPGTQQVIGDLEFVIEEATPQQIILKVNGQRQRLELGKNLRELLPLETAATGTNAPSTDTR